MSDAPRWRMPAEWEAHRRTWMAFPPANQTFGPDGSPGLADARRAWAQVAATISPYEPVVLVAAPGEGDAALAAVGHTGEVTVVERPIDDAWVRDSGPTFVVGPAGELGAVDWAFNGWGGQAWASWEHDALLAADIGAQSGAQVLGSAMVNEGGGFHVDGAGTVLLTDTVQRDPGRNAGWSREQVEGEVHRLLGTTTAVWLPRGLTRDYGEFGTRGHVDIVATFVRPGVVAVHHQPDPAHPDHEVTTELHGLLRAARDASGRPLEVVSVSAPAVLEEGDDWVDYSYINHYVGNSVVVVGTFDDPRDADAVALLSRLYPGRRVERADGRTIFSFGGGVHCITQQEPLPSE